MTTNTETNNDAAVKVFTGLCKEIEELARSIYVYAADHMDISPDSVNWGHVGDAARCVVRLDAVIEDLTLRIESK